MERKENKDEEWGRKKMSALRRIQFKDIRWESIRD